MDTPGYWVCKHCFARNLNQLRFCVGCDAPRETSLPPDPPLHSVSRTRSPPRGPSAGQMSPYDSINNRSTTTRNLQSSSDEPSSSFHHQPSPMKESVTPSRGIVDRISPTRPSPSSSRAAAATSDSSPLPPIVPPEMHAGGGSPASIQAYERLNLSLSLKDHENRELRLQLDDAMRAHGALLREFKSSNTSSQSKDSDIEILSSEIMSLRVRLEKEETLRKEISERHAIEISSRERVISTQKDQIEGLCGERDRLLDKLQNMTISQSQVKVNDAAHATSVLGQKEREIVGLNEQIKGLQERHSEALGTVAKLTREVEDYRTNDTRVRTNHAEDIQRVLRDTLATNEQVIDKITKELMESKQEAEKNWEKERALLHSQYNKAVADGAEVKRVADESVARETEHAKSLQVALEKLQFTRDELQSENKFQLEIISDLKADRAGLQAEVNTLRDTISQFPLPGFDPRRDPVMSLVRPTLVNQTINNTATPSTNNTTTTLSSHNGAQPEDGGQQQQHHQQQSGTSPPTQEPSFSVSRTTLDPATSMGNLDGTEDETGARLQELEFENGELKKQLTRAQSTLKNRDSDLAEAHEMVEELEKSLASEKVFSEEQDKEIKKLEQKLADQSKELHGQIAELTKQNKDLLEQNVTLREKCDATDVAMLDMEQAFADAIDAAASKQHGGNPSSRRAMDGSLLSVSDGSVNGRGGVSGSGEGITLSSPPPAISAARRGTHPFENSQEFSQGSAGGTTLSAPQRKTTPPPSEVPVTPPTVSVNTPTSAAVTSVTTAPVAMNTQQPQEEEELGEEEKKELLDGFKEGSKALKGLSALQRRMKKK